LFCGQPPNFQAAVPLVTTPARALSMYCSCCLLSGSLPWATGAMFLTTLPVGETTALARDGW
jgi:hypothetical protein